MNNKAPQLEATDNHAEVSYIERHKIQMKKIALVMQALSEMTNR